MYRRLTIWSSTCNPQIRRVATIFTLKVSYLCHNRPTPRNLGLKGGNEVEIGIVLVAAVLALAGTSLATMLTNGTDDWAGQVKRAEKSRAKMKKALGK